MSDDDMLRMEAGKISELEETLAWLADNTAMTLAALSSTSLLDKGIYDFPLSQTFLDERITMTGFKPVNLSNIMRCSQNIAAATSTASVNAARTIMNIHEKISPGSSSTVPGTRPLAMLCKFSGVVDYTKLAGFVSKHLRTLPTGTKVAVLCDTWISARKMSEQLREEDMPVTCYHGGVERFYGYTPVYFPEVGTDDGGEAELTEWLEAEHGILVTHFQQFRGCEADAVICVERDWGYYNDSRSPVTRAVAHLCLITSDLRISVPEMRRYWELEIMEEGVGEIDAEKSS